MPSLTTGVGKFADLLGWEAGVVLGMRKLENGTFSVHKRFLQKLGDSDGEKT